MQFLQHTLGSFLDFIHKGVTVVLPNPNISYGVAIILFTIIVRIILLPFNIKQIKSSLIMNEMQPKLKEIQNKYKSDPKRLQEEMSRLYKQYNVSPLSGCLPVLIQMPIIFSLFYVFRDLNSLNGVGFLWVKNLCKPDNTYILPILAGLTQYFSMVLTMNNSNNNDPQGKQTKVLNFVMSIVTVIFGLKFNASLALYWTVNNLFQAIQTIIIRNHTKKVA